ncbi:inorganic pyrophosphatase [Klebsormidium nitens]|uniref:inorganic diphosphatase n=1 Tax=Klebsormidium nitens TaxID=105231 RepID=A0A1Y1I885_KLENI|nr:inorganic pyrophosphatase [Klebsormidium nitens]|eukprot:GAQ85351.1 inorganic pyrophosphatase [Klebsormidium nitens]
MAAVHAVRASSLSAGAARAVTAASSCAVSRSTACRAVFSRVPAARSVARTPTFLGGAAKLPVVQAVKTATRQICSSTIRSKYVVKTEGAPDSLEFRAFIQDDEGNTVSPWHDIPLKAGDGLYNFICEIPKETKAKMEVATDESSTPIKQDTKKGKLRFYPYNINWNYGMLPQTWEDPSHANPDVKNSLGDNDPVDVVEISDRVAEIGEVYAVKPLAVLAMIDEGELDWKVVAIRADDPKADKVSDIEDVEREFPGTLEAIRVWFRDYKTPDGKPQNEFGFDDKPQSAAYAKKVIEETNQFWSKLVTRVTDKGDLSLV